MALRHRIGSCLERIVRDNTNSPIFQSVIQRSSVVERSAVNRLVVGSNPTAGAKDPEDLLAIIHTNGSCVAHYLRRLHNLALDLGWLPWPILANAHDRKSLLKKMQQSLLQKKIRSAWRTTNCFMKRVPPRPPQRISGRKTLIGTAAFLSIDENAWTVQRAVSANHRLWTPVCSLTFL